MTDAASYIELNPDEPRHATHEMEGQFLTQRVDAKGRLYYLDVESGKRIATSGKVPVPLEDRLAHHRMDDDGSPPVPDRDLRFTVPGSVEALPDPLPETPGQGELELDLEIYALAVSALASHFGRTDRGPYSARKRSDHEVILTLPGKMGDERLLITLPERVRIAAVAYNGEFE